MNYVYRGLPDGYVPCKRCKKLIRRDMVEQHMETHRLNNEQNTVENGSDAPIPFGSTNDLGRFAEKPLPNLDATKNMGYPAREDRGKYGSGASRDDFDDESES